MSGSSQQVKSNSKPAVDRDGAGLSVERIFLILETLAESGRPQTLTEIALGLDLPKSSLLKLLRGLSNLGYLSEDPSSKTYFPSLGICNLGKRIEDLLVGHNEHLSMLEAIRDAASEAVSLATQHGVYAQYHSCLPGIQPLTLNLTDGVRYPIHRSAAGRALLGALSDADFDKLLYRFNKVRDEQFADVDPDKLRRDVKRFARRGFATSDSAIASNLLSIAKLLPLPEGVRPIAVSVGGQKSRMKAKQKEIVEILSGVIDSYYPPVG